MSRYWYDLYTRYKRDTRYLVHWMIRASTEVIQTSSRTSAKHFRVDKSGPITIERILSMAELIADHSESIPSVIFRVLQSVIDARKATNRLFEQLLQAEPSQELERSNSSHKVFVESLEKVFQILGGPAWKASQKADVQDTDDNDEIERILTNRFSVLNIEGSLSSEEENEDDDDNRIATHRASGRPNAQPRGSRRGLKRTGRINKRRKPHGKQVSLDDIPLYRIIEQGEPSFMDFVPAALAAIDIWIDLRNYCQRCWRSVADAEVNAATAGAVSRVALTTIKRLDASFFADFPEHDSFHTIVETITRGKTPEQCRALFTAKMDAGCEDPQCQCSDSGAPSGEFDIKEQFMIYTYAALMEFLTDVRKKGTMEPTKAMQKKLNKWNPKLDLGAATKEQRLEWRQIYTLQLLYNFIEVYHVSMEHTITVSVPVPEIFAASCPDFGPSKRIWGIQDYVEELLRLISLPQGTNMRSCIVPRYVFQLQLIVDSFTEPKGWKVDFYHGDVIGLPRKDFNPFRDVRSFLGDPERGSQRGMNWSLIALCKQYVDEGRHPADVVLLGGIGLGAGRLLHDLSRMNGASILPLRPRGTCLYKPHQYAWYESPYISGTGLLEAVEITHEFGSWLVGRSVEPLLILHIHNMLWKLDVVPNPVPLLVTLTERFRYHFFFDGKIPSSNFGRTMYHCLELFIARRPRVERRSNRGNRNPSNMDGDDRHGSEQSRNTKVWLSNKTNMAMYASADWELERIPMADMSLDSELLCRRLSELKQMKDPKTGKKTRDVQALLKMAKSRQVDEGFALNLLGLLVELNTGVKTQEEIPQALRDFVPENLSKKALAYLEKLLASILKLPNRPFGDVDRLGLMTRDMGRDINSDRATVGFNYTMIIVMCHNFFGAVEAYLKEKGNVRYQEILRSQPNYEGVWSQLTKAVLFKEDHEIAVIMAMVLDDYGKKDHTYQKYLHWEDQLAEDEMEPTVGNFCRMM